MTGYELTRAWFDFAFENTKRVKPTHAALYFFVIELWNRAGQKEEFGLPAYYAMEATGIGSYNTYKSAFDDLVNFGFIKLIKKSINQHTANIVALSIFDKASNKALDKALTTHTTKQVESTVQSTDAIIEPLNQETNKPLNHESGENEFSQPTPEKKIEPVETKKNEVKKFVPPDGQEVELYFFSLRGNVWPPGEVPDEARAFMNHFSSNGWKVGGKAKMVDWRAAVQSWIRRKEKEYGTKQGNIKNKPGSSLNEAKRRAFEDIFK